MNRSIIASNTYQLGVTSDYTILQSLGEEPVSMESPSRLSDSWDRFILTSQSWGKSTTVAVIISSKTTTAEMPAIQIEENLSAEDREARTKGLQLVAGIEHLYRTDEGFRRWYHEGIDQIEAGQYVIFDENGWKEE